MSREVCTNAALAVMSLTTACQIWHIKAVDHALLAPVL